MSTRSIIGIKISPTKGKFIYCHFDGYPQGVGKILLNYYTDKSTVESLVALGNISVLEKNVNPNPLYIHTFDKPQNDVTVAYHRDRGEDYSDYGIIPFNLEGVRGLWDIEYGYYFDPEKNEWYIMDMNTSKKDHVWRPLIDFLN